MSVPGHPFRILSPAEADAAMGAFDLVVERSSFGGGTHPTTQSCLDLLAAMAPLSGTVLDLGSGTGILALAAIRLGAERALCVDVNPDCVASARRNAAANGIAERIDHCSGGIGDVSAAAFDLVVANIGGDLLLDEAVAVTRAARPGGRLLLSGLLRGHADELAAAYGRLGCGVVERRFPAKFCTVLLRRG